MRATTEASWTACIEEAVVQILNDLDLRATAVRLAERACFSTYHFHRMFSGYTGETAREMTRRLLLERAAWSLRNNQTVGFAAFEAGFDSVEAFSRAFRAAYACKPSSFAHNAVPVDLPAPNSVHWNPDKRIPLSLRTNVPKGEPMDIQIRQLPKTRYFALRHNGAYDQCDKTWEQFCKVVPPELKMDNMLMVFHDNPDIVPTEKLRSDIGGTVGPGAKLPEGMIEGTLEGGTYVVATYKGPYPGIGRAWGELCGHEMPSRNLKSREALCFEFYLNDPETVPEDELITELWEPIEDSA